MEIGMIRPLEHLGDCRWSAFTFVAQPLLHILEGVALHRMFTVKGELLEGSRVKTVAAADGCKQGIEMSFRSVPTGEGVEHLTQPHCEQSIDLELFLMTEQVQLHQKLIGCTAIQRWNHVGESAVEGALAVSNGQMLTQVATPKRYGLDHSAAEAAVRIAGPKNGAA